MSKHHHLLALGKNIRKLRENKGFTQESFADHAGLDRSYYGGIERGERNVATLNLFKIAHALGVEISELFTMLEINKKKYVKRS